MARRASRRSTSLLVLCVLLVGLFVAAAVTAEGRASSLADANDGGAWLVNQRNGVVGHANRVVGELTGTVRVADRGADVVVRQRDDTILAVDRTAGALVLVDDRTHQAVNQVDLPGDAVVLATSSGAVVAELDPLVVRVAERGQLAQAEGIDDLAEVMASDGGGIVEVGRDDAVVVLDRVAERVVVRSGGTERVVAVAGAATAHAVTVVGDRVVLLVDDGLLVVDDDGFRPLDVDGLGGAWRLEQPRVGGEDVVLVSPDGRVLRVGLGDGATTELAQVDPGAALRPIVHGGCTYVVTTDVARLHRVACQDPGDDDDRELRPSSGSSLELTLVNGWVWVNDVISGAGWVFDDAGEVRTLVDWDQALAPEEAEGDAATGDGERDATVLQDQDAEAFASADQRGDGPNRAPRARPDDVSTRFGRPVLVPVLANDVDPDSDALLVTSAAATDADGARVEVTPDRQQLQVTPPPTNDPVVLRFSYVVGDGRGGEAGAEVVVRVTDDGNQAPLTVADVVATRAGTSATINVLDNDVDPDGDVLTLVGVEGEGATWRYAPDGTVTVTPDASGQAGAVPLTYVVEDDAGERVTGDLRVDVRLEASNQRPEARNDTLLVAVGRPARLRALDNDTDPDGDTLQVGSALELVASPSLEVDAQLAPDGEFLFVPAEAGSYVFVYGATDGQEEDLAAIRVDAFVAERNEPPVAVRDDVVIPVGGTRIVPALANDGDPDGDVLHLVDVAAVPDALDVEFVDGIGFRVEVRSGAPARPSFRYQVTDGLSDPVGALVVVAVATADDTDQPPVARRDVATLRAGRTVTVDVLTNDSDPEGQPLQVVELSGQPASVGAEPALDGTAVRLTLPAGLDAGFRLDYVVADVAGNRARSDLQVRVVALDEANRPPFARPDVGRVRAGEAVTVPVLANDVDPDGDAVAIESIAMQPPIGVVDVVPDGLRYRAPTRARGTYRFSYVVVDGAGGRSRGEVLVGVLPANEPNRPPTAVDDAIRLRTGAAARSLVVVGNDVDLDGDDLRVVDVTASADVGVEIAEDGRALVLRPPTEVPGAFVERTLTYTVADGNGGTDRGDVVVGIEDPDELEDVEDDPATQRQRPVAVDDRTGPHPPGALVTVDVRGNDRDPDGDVADLRISTTDPGVRVVGGGSLALRVDRTRELAYTVTDGDGLRDNGVLTVVVVENRPPVVRTLVQGLDAEQEVRLTLAGQAVDPDGDTLTYTCCTDERGGTVRVVEQGVGALDVRFRAAAGHEGPAGFGYTVSDGEGHVVGGAVRLDVAAAADEQPVVRDGALQVRAGGRAVLDLAALADDPEGDALVYRLIAVDTVLDVELSRSALLVSVPGAVSGGPAGSVRFRAIDRSGQSSTARVALEVLPADTPRPEPIDDAVALAAGTSQVVDVLRNDRGDQLRVAGADAAGGGLQVQVVPGGLQVAADRATSGRVDVVYRVEDGQGRTATAVLAVEVAGLPGTPGSPDVDVVDGTARLAWAPPAANGSALVRHDVEHDGGGSAQAGTGGAYTWSGLPAGVAYRFRVRAVNAVGAGVWSAWSAPVQLAQLPGRPSAPRVTPEDGRLRVAWVPPDDGGAGVTGYNVEIGGAQRGVRSVTGREIVWPDLVNGQNYTFRVQAVSAGGEGAFSEPSASEHPFRRPDPPIIGATVQGDQQLVPTWSPGFDGGDPITRYELRRNDGAVQDVGARTSHAWGGLSNGQAFAFQVRAYNRSAQPSEWSDLSSPVRACGAPQATVLASEAGDGRVSVSWSTDGNGCDVETVELVAVAAGGGARTVPFDATPGGGVIDGLANGVAYSITASAISDADTSNRSAPSNAVTETPFGPPFPPSPVTVGGADNGVEAIVAFGRADGNGRPITDYQLEVNNGAPQSLGPEPTALRVPLGGAGESTCVRVRSVSTAGAGPWSGQACYVAPRAPGTVRALAAAADVGTVTWSWSAPADDGGAVVTTYELELDGVPAGNVSPGAGGGAFASASEGEQHGLRVRACNRVGCGAWSPAVVGAGLPLPE